MKFLDVEALIHNGSNDREAFLSMRTYGGPYLTEDNLLGNRWNFMIIKNL